MTKTPVRVGPGFAGTLKETAPLVPEVTPVIVTKFELFTALHVQLEGLAVTATEPELALESKVNEVAILYVQPSSPNTPMPLVVPT